jgi:hypothetical protein
MTEQANEITLRNLFTELAVRRCPHLGDVVALHDTRTMVHIKQVMVVLRDLKSAVHTLADFEFGVNRSVTSLENVLLGPAVSAVTGFLGGVEFGWVGRSAPTAVTHRLFYSQKITQQGKRTFMPPFPQN